MIRGLERLCKLCAVCASLLMFTDLVVTAQQDNGPPQPRSIEELVFKAAHVTPSPQQLAFQEMEFYAFVHFNLPTFIGDKGTEQGTGKESPALFNPTDFDATQWVRVCKEAGMKMIVLVAKHHEGFCLWPSKYTEYSVKNSPWRNGKGDMVKEVSDACREGGIKFGFYLSPWDLHEPTHGTPAYDEFFKNQLRELLTNYGEITEVWFDGAGADRHNHDWESYHSLIHQFQPNALVRIALAPSKIEAINLRWFGLGQTSRGARESEWSVIPLARKDFSERGFWKNHQQIDLGSREKLKDADKLIWWPTEFDIPIRDHWFYNPDQKPKSLEYLLDCYYQSVGRNATFMLNLSPDRRGLIPSEDIQRLQELRAVLNATFEHNVASGAKAKASDLRSTEGGPDFAHDADRTVDYNKETYWTVNDGTTAATIEYDLGKKQTFNRAMLQEYIKVGQRIEEFVLDAWDGQVWSEFARATTVGYKRLLRFDDVTAKRVRLRITQSRVCPTISNFGLFYAPPINEVLPMILNEQEKTEGFVPLFNGRDLNGWTGNTKCYLVNNGTIILDPNLGWGNLYTVDEYADFIFRFEFRLTPGANNGLGIRTPMSGDPAYVGMEIQILDDTSPEYSNLSPYQYHGSIYGVVPAKRGHLKPIGEWNSEEVIAKGRQVKVKLNGITIVDANLDKASTPQTMDEHNHPGLKRDRGHIAFCGHPGRVEFRNIRIKILD
jgi:alpha-L-fucosidase